MFDYNVPPTNRCLMFQEIYNLFTIIFASGMALQNGDVSWWHVTMQKVQVPLLNGVRVVWWWECGPAGIGCPCMAAEVGASSVEWVPATTHRNESVSFYSETICLLISTTVSWNSLIPENFADPMFSRSFDIPQVVQARWSACIIKQQFVEADFLHTGFSTFSGK